MAEHSAAAGNIRYAFVGGDARAFCGSADHAVRAVGVPDEVFCVSAGITSPMLRKKNAIRMISPSGTRTPYIIGAEALRKISAGYRATDILDKPAHPQKAKPSPVR
jgi:hypothetical protein